MSDSDSPSNRHKKRIVQEGLRALKKKPGWDVSAIGQTDPLEKLRDLDQEIRGNQVYGESGVCGACVKAREAEGDETALCDEHLAKAMGF